MRDNSAILRTLIELGMNEREAKVYLALLQKKAAIAAELQRTSGIPQNKIYDTINSLLHKGYFAEKRESRNRFFEIVDPKTSLSNAFDDLRRRHENAIEHRRMIEELYENHKPVGEPFEYIEIIRGNENTHRKYIELLRNTKTELLGFTRPPFASSQKAMKEEQENVYQSYIEHGGDFRGVYEVNENSPPRMFCCIYDSMRHGEKFRIVPKLPLKMFIFDRQTLLMAEKESLISGDHLVNTVIKQNATVNGYIALFDYFWEQGVEYEQWIRGKEKLIEQKLAEFEKITE
jgi:hypothetical protein